MRPEDLAGLVTPRDDRGSADARRPDFGFHQGVVVTWNATTNQNVINVAGSSIPDVAILSTTDSILLVPGDAVALLRFKSTYFLLGRIALPGVTRALGMQVARDVAPDTITSLTFASLGGPTLTDVLVGSSRRLLMIGSAFFSVGTTNFASFGFRVDGVSNISAAEDGSLTNNSTTIVHQATITGVHLFVASDTLNQGGHTVEMVYRIGNGAGGTTSVSDRTVIALPF